MLKKLSEVVRDERGMGTVEVLIITAVLAIIAVGAYTVLKPNIKAAAETLGKKTKQAADDVGSTKW